MNLLRREIQASLNAAVPSNDSLSPYEMMLGHVFPVVRLFAAQTQIGLSARTHKRVSIWAKTHFAPMGIERCRLLPEVRGQVL